MLKLKSQYKTQQKEKLQKTTKLQYLQIFPRVETDPDNAWETAIFFRFKKKTLKPLQVEFYQQRKSCSVVFLSPLLVQSAVGNTWKAFVVFKC